MDAIKIKEKIALAEESVKNIADEKLRIKAFELVLNKLLSSEGKESASDIKTPPLLSEPLKSEDIMQKELNVSSLATAAGFEISDLENVFEFSDNEFHIIADTGGSKEVEKQRNAALILLTAQYYCKGIKEIKAGVLRKKMEDMGIKSLFNMATNLKNFENFVLKIGAKSSTETKYRITTPGLQKGLELIRIAAQKKNNIEGKS